MSILQYDQFLLVSEHPDDGCVSDMAEGFKILHDFITNKKCVRNNSPVVLY